MATVFFAIIDLVAAVGLWIGASWGVIIWLASSVTMIVVHALLSQIYGFQPVIIVAEIALIVGYVFIALKRRASSPNDRLRPAATCINICISLMGLTG